MTKRTAIRARRAVPWLMILIAATAGDAQAYLDPGSGSMLLQLLLGGTVGVATVVKLYWKRWTARITGRRSEESERHGTSQRERRQT